MENHEWILEVGLLLHTRWAGQSFRMPSHSSVVTASTRLYELFISNRPVQANQFSQDYTSSTLTKWGMAEVQQNYETLGGSMLYRLIHRALPKWFKFNSLYVMQPMYLPSMNKEIAKQFNTLDLYCPDPPAAPPKMTILSSHAAISSLLNDQKNFKVKYGVQLPDLVFADYMLQGDGAANRDNHKFVAQRMMNIPGGLDLYARSFEEKMQNVLKREAYTLGNFFQVDITKE